MYPIIGRYGPFFLHSYTVVMGVGILAGLVVTGWLNRQTRRPYWLDMALAGLLGGLVGGRLGFVMGHWAYFQERPLAGWQLWQGGLSYHGALLTGLVAMWITHYLIYNSPALTNFLDLLAPGFALAHAFGWLACWLEGCAYGQEATIGWLTADLPDEFGVFAVRYQTQLAGILVSLLVFGVGGRWQAKGRVWVVLAGLGFGRFGISLLRGDAAPLFLAYRVDTWLDVGLTLLALTLLQYGRWQNKKHQQSWSKNHEIKSRTGTNDSKTG